MKKGILLFATGQGSNWIGGLYYRKNILFSLLQNENITKKYRFYIFVDRENLNVFESFRRNKNVSFIFKKKRGKLNKISLGFSIIFRRVRIIYPMDTKFPLTIPVEWIPDFQHFYLPQFFSQEEIKNRTYQFKCISESPFPLMLSSQSALHDMKEHFPCTDKRIYVLPFVSYIEDIIKKITPECELAVLEKFDLTNVEYATVMNQFWQHKNHIVVFKAMKEFYKKHLDSKLQFVFSGKMSDYRNPEYIESLKRIVEDPIIKDHIKLLGFMDRDEQIVVMKNAKFVIQPSLFEGWGTVLEDAKVLDKTVLLSNIRIHQEQRDDNCLLFDPYNEKELAELIYKASSLNRTESVQKGIDGMYKRALLYSKGFEQMLKEIW